jgi:hypothetical protein
MGAQAFFQAFLEAMEAAAPLVRLSRSAVVAVAQIMTTAENPVAVEEEVGTATLAPPLCKLTKLVTVGYTDTASRAASGLLPPGMAEGVEVLEG